MAYYLVKADETRNIKVGDEYVRTLTATLNNFFVTDYIPEGLTNYYVDLPMDIWDDFVFTVYNQGKKIKKGFDPFNGRVEINDQDLPAGYINYSEEQVQRRIEIFKFLGKVFLDDALRTGKIDDDTHSTMLTELLSINDNDTMNSFYTNMNFGL